MKKWIRCREILASILFFSLLIGCREDRALTIFEEAEGLWKDGRYREAVVRYEEVVKTNPQNELASKAIYKVGIIHDLYLLNYEEALATFKRLAYLFPESKETHLAKKHIADIYMNKVRDYKRAIFKYQQLIDEGVIDEPDKAQFNIAMAYLKSGDFIQARIEFNELIEQYAFSLLIPEASYHIASSFMLEGETELAIKEYQKVKDAYPESPFFIESKFGIAMVLEEMGKLEEALNHYREIEGEYPNPSVVSMRIERLESRLKR